MPRKARIDAPEGLFHLIGPLLHCDMKQVFMHCPVYNPGDGFHSMFQKSGDKIKWLFLCPSCHRIFDLGFTIPEQ